MGDEAAQLECRSLGELIVVLLKTRLRDGRAIHRSATSIEV
jgi:hypothetical protein